MNVTLNAYHHLTFQFVFPNLKGFLVIQSRLSIYQGSLSDLTNSILIYKKQSENDELLLKENKLTIKSLFKGVKKNFHHHILL